MASPAGVNIRFGPERLIDAEFVVM